MSIDKFWYFLTRVILVCPNFIQTVPRKADAIKENTKRFQKKF
jgi:hypothetical protein